MYLYFNICQSPLLVALGSFLLHILFRASLPQRALHSFLPLSFVILWGNVCLTTLARHLSLGICRLVTSAWDIPLETFVWGLWLGSTRASPSVHFKRSGGPEASPNGHVERSDGTGASPSNRFERPAKKLSPTTDRFRFLSWNHWLGNFCLGSFAWRSSLGNFHLGASILDLSIGNVRFKTVAWKLPLMKCRFESLAWK